LLESKIAIVTRTKSNSYDTCAIIMSMEHLLHIHLSQLSLKHLSNIEPNTQLIVCWAESLGT